jgi:hypothetical protein
MDKSMLIFSCYGLDVEGGNLTARWTDHGDPGVNLNLSAVGVIMYQEAGKQKIVVFALGINEHLYKRSCIEAIYFNNLPH